MNEESPEHHDYAVGDIVGGTKIVTIFEQRKGVVIFLTEKNTLAWKIEPELFEKTDHIRFAIAKCRELHAIIEMNIEEERVAEAMVILGNALSSALLAASKREGLSYFKKITQFVETYRIKYTVTAEPTFKIYITQDDRVRFWHDDPEAHNLAITEFQSLRNLADSLLPATSIRQVSNRLATALRSAFKSESEEWKDNFAEIKKYIISMSMFHVRTQYSLYSFGIGIILSLPVACLYLFSLSHQIFLSPSIIIGGMGGLLGAFISILHRCWDIDIDPGIPRRSLAFQALTRMCLGLIFGGIVIILAESNLVLGAINKNIHSLFVLAIISGFSERFIPDIMEKIAKREVESIKDSKSITS